MEVFAEEPNERRVSTLQMMSEPVALLGCEPELPGLAEEQVLVQAVEVFGGRAQHVA